MITVNLILKTFYLCFIICFLISCSNNRNSKSSLSETMIDVDTKNFLTGGLVEPISIVSRTLSNGEKADCYKIVTKSTPTDHQMGPWCPSNIADDASKGGIWMEHGKVYDVDGAFIKNLATLYKDTSWKMYNASTGEITKTKTEEDCRAAANPNVGAAYKNYCVQCLPSYVSTFTRTIYLPVTPVKLKVALNLGSGQRGGPPPGDRPAGPPTGDRPGRNAGPGIRGIAFNGVVFDPPAPVNAILGAYTLAPFDDAGGHINMNEGYHYHAATGVSTKLKQTDGHAAMIGYAIDGFGLYENLDANGKESTDLDACRGHYDKTRGYHYHVDKAGANNFINCLSGAYAN